LFFIKLESTLVGSSHFKLYLSYLLIFHLYKEVRKQCSTDTLFSIVIVYGQHEDSCGVCCCFDADEKPDEGMIVQGDEEAFRK